MNNRIDDVPQRVMDRIDGIMSALAHCKGATCRNPYSILHPGGEVFTFSDAMDAQFDGMYSKLVKFQFVRCRALYATSNEPTWTLGFGPQPVDRGTDAVVIAPTRSARGLRGGATGRA